MPPKGWRKNAPKKKARLGRGSVKNAEKFLSIIDDEGPIDLTSVYAVTFKTKGNLLVYVRAKNFGDAESEAIKLLEAGCDPTKPAKKNSRMKLHDRAEGRGYVEVRHVDGGVREVEMLPDSIVERLPAFPPIAHLLKK